MYKLFAYFASAALIFAAGDPTRSAVFTSENDVHLSRPMSVQHFKIFPKNTVIAGNQSRLEEGLAEKGLRMWFWPETMEQFYGLYPIGAKPNVPDENTFINRIKRRDPTKDYLAVIAEAQVRYDSQTYDVIKYYEYQDGGISGSGVKSFLKAGDDKYLLCHLPPELHPFLRCFWETEAGGFAFLLYNDNSFIDSKQMSEVAEGLRKIRNDCLTESGEFCVPLFMQEVDRIGKSGSQAERLALKCLMVQPMLERKPIVLTPAQIEQIQSELSDLQAGQKEAVLGLIERGTVVDAIIALKDYRKISLGDAKILVEGWIGEGRISKGPGRGKVDQQKEDMKK